MKAFIDIRKSISNSIYLLAALFFTAGFQNYASAQETTFLTNGLVLYYPFNGNANDAIGTNNGVVFGAILTNDMFGNPNRAYYFDGSSYIQIPTSTNVFGSEDFTISIWFNPITYPNPQITSQAGCFLISKGQNNFELATGSLTDSNGMNFLPRPATGNNWYTPAGTFQTNVWQHVVAIYQPSATNIQVFVNGAPLSLSGPATTPVGADIQVPARLGMRSDGTLAFTGSLSFIRIYNRALSPQEVSTLYQFESGAPSTIGAPTGGLIHYYPFNGNANDMVGTNNGTVFNATLASDRFGNPNHAYSFNGTNSYIACPDTGFPAGNAPRTISLWIYWRSFGVPAPTDTPVISYGSGQANDTYYLILFDSGLTGYPNNTIAVGESGGGGVGNHPLWMGIQLNQWYHISFSDNGTNAQLYINGLLEGTTARAFATVLNGQFQIGSYTSAIANPPYPPTLDGFINDVRVYNRALSSQEVSQLYAAESGTSAATLIGIVTLPGITINGVAGEVYSVQYLTNLSTPNWITLASNIVVQTNALFYIDTNALYQPQRFYRVVPQ